MVKRADGLWAALEARLADINPLLAVMARLREPGGCPWDREQTHESLKPMLVEEAYEVLAAIDAGDDRALCDELGDLLLQVVFHARLAEEAGRFGMAEVIEAIRAKIVRRHPHVFGQARADSSAEVLTQWNRIKEEERAARGQSSQSVLDGLAPGLPPLSEAWQLGQRAAREGFDWPEPAGVVDKLREEIVELEEAVRRERPDPEAIRDEMGDILFSVVNLCRHLGVDPESAVRRANGRFRHRFQQIERRLEAEGRKPRDCGLDELERHWQEAKACRN